VKLAGQTTAGYSDGVLQITAPAGNRILGSSGAVEVTVQLPAGSRVEAKAASAQFTTAGQLGDVTFDSSQATVKVDVAGTHGTVALRTETGAITVGAAAGISAILDAGTTLGRIHNALKNTGGTPDLTINATATVGDITARSGPAHSAPES
jgi:hypothetical protein